MPEHMTSSLKDRSRGQGAAELSFLDRQVTRGILKNLLDAMPEMTAADIEDVVAIHESEIAEGIFTELGRRFLTLFYRQVVAGESARGYVVKKKGRVIGFIAGSSDAGTFLKKFFKRYYFQIGLIVLKRIIFQPSFLPKLVKRVYVNRNKDNCAESLAGAVLKEHQTTGYGLVLLRKLIDDCRRAGADRIQCDVVEDLKNPAVVKLHRMYQKGGYRPIGEYHAGRVKYIRYMRYL